MVVLLAIVSLYATTWVDAKGLMIASPVVVLIAWSGIAALRATPRLHLGRRTSALLGAGTAALALALAGGALASDAAQYHAATLAPTARYEELASLDRRYAHRGPVLFADFDEYALDVLRDLDVGGPDFTYPPPALAAVASGHGARIELDRAPPSALAAYPLIITRRDPAATPPPTAYGEVREGAYYVVWQRTHGAPVASAHLAPALAGARGFCARLTALVAAARAHGARLVAAERPAAISIAVRDLARRIGWGRTPYGLVMSRPAALRVGFSVPAAGTWDVYLAGEFSPPVDLRVDGRAIATIEGQLGGNSLVPNITAPVPVTLGAGSHVLVVSRRRGSLAPGDGGAALLDRIYLAPSGAPARTLVTLDPRASAAQLCSRPYAWVESLPPARA